MSLHDLPPDARPREKLLARGPQALADAELLALLLRTGIQGTPVLQLAPALLDALRRRRGRCATPWGVAGGCCTRGWPPWPASRAGARPSAPRSPPCWRSPAARCCR